MSVLRVKRHLLPCQGSEHRTNWQAPCGPTQSRTPKVDTDSCVSVQHGAWSTSHIIYSVTTYRLFSQRATCDLSGLSFHIYKKLLS